MQREARALGLSMSAYIGFLVEKGRERVAVHAELAHLSPELRRLLWTVYVQTAETQVLTRALSAKLLDEKTVRVEQDGIVEAVKEWRRRLLLETEAQQGGST